LYENRRKYVREDKAIAVDPVGVLRVESHKLVKDNMSHRGHAHRGARVTRVCLECGIDLFRSLNQQWFANASAAQCWEKDCDSGVAVLRETGGAATRHGQTYRKGADGVDGELVDLSVRHDGQIRRREGDG
jgi:hypothetical protein